MILLELMMPNKSGVRMFQELKTDPWWQRIPVVIVTGVSQATGVDFRHFVAPQAEGFGQPAVSRTGDTRYRRSSGFLEKPVEPEELLKAVSQALEGEGAP